MDRRRFQRVSIQMPRYHSNHCTLVAVIYAEREEKLKQYRCRMQWFTLSLPHGPWTQLDAGYEELQQHVIHYPPRERPTNKWITDTTWKTVNCYTMLSRKGMLSKTAVRNHLGWKIKACLKADCLQCAATTASNDEGCLAVGEYIEIWHHLKGWYRLAEDRVPKPCLETLANCKLTRGSSYKPLSPPPGVGNAAKCWPLQRPWCSSNRFRIEGGSGTTK